MLKAVVKEYFINGIIVPGPRFKTILRPLMVGKVTVLLKIKANISRQVPINVYPSVYMATPRS
jgi:hypothetical protein